MGGARAAPDRAPRRRPLLVHAAELLREPGATRTIDVTVPASDLGVSDHRVTGDVHVVATLESTSDRLLAHARLTVRYQDVCARCLASIDEPLEVSTDEQYSEEPPPDDPEHEAFLDSFPIEHGQIDLAPMVRETLLLAVPDAPLCRLACKGLCPICGVDRNLEQCTCDTTVRDDRWAALDSLRDQL